MHLAWRYISNLLRRERTWITSNRSTLNSERNFCGLNRLQIEPGSIFIGGSGSSYAVRGSIGEMTEITQQKWSHIPTSGWRSLLRPSILFGGVSSLLQQVATLKVKGRLRRRCKDCYIVFRQQRAYVMCPTHGRHKQMSMKKREKSTWILTHATQSKIRPY